MHTINQSHSSETHCNLRTLILGACGNLRIYLLQSQCQGVRRPSSAESTMLRDRDPYCVNDGIASPQRNALHRAPLRGTCDAPSIYLG